MQYKQQDPLIIMGDFNTKVGEWREENMLGPHGFGVRNILGEALVDRCYTNKYTVGNT